MCKSMSSDCHRELLATLSYYFVLPATFRSRLSYKYSFSKAQFCKMLI